MLKIGHSVALGWCDFLPPGASPYREPEAKDEQWFLASSTHCWNANDSGIIYFYAFTYQRKKKHVLDSEVKFLNIRVLG